MELLQKWPEEAKVFTGKEVGLLLLVRRPFISLNCSKLSKQVRSSVGYGDCNKNIEIHVNA